MNLLCFGYGQVAKNLVSNLLKKKVNLNLTISTREKSSIKKLGDFEFEVKYCEYSVYMIGQCMCPNYFPQVYLHDV